MTLTTTNQGVELSIIIPTFNEASVIGQTLGAVAMLREVVEVIVVDGGSDDETVQIARERGARVLRSERGRGAQMHAGACAARGEALWFLHADTQPAPDSSQQIVEALRDPHVVAGHFNVGFDSSQFSARFLTWLYRLLRRLGLCYGDSAIFVRRETYERVGGFKPFPIFEDLDLVRRLRKHGRMAHLVVRANSEPEALKPKSDQEISMAYYEEDDLQRFSEIAKHRPDLFEKFMAWYQACQEDGALSRREKALIGLAVAHALQCPYCIDAFSQACLESGSNLEQMTEAIHMASALRGGASLIHGLQAHNSVKKVSM